MRGFPDPVLSASVFCNLCLDFLLRDAILPFWRNLGEAHPDRPKAIWFVRYGKNGEHLKLRIHGHPEVAHTARDTLESFLQPFFDSPLSEPPEGRWVSKSALPAIDPEDAVEEDYPNKSVLWTSYRRSPIHLGNEIYARSDAHLERFLETQEAAAELVLAKMSEMLDEPNFTLLRHNQLTKLILVALGSLDFGPDKWVDYLAYHRDWLLKSLLRDVAPASTTYEALISQFDSRIERMPRAIEVLSEQILQGCRKEAPVSQDPSLLGRWGEAFEALYCRISSYRGQARYDVDPFTEDNAYLPLFKALHLAANQFGFRLSHEAYAYQILYTAACRALEVTDTPLEATAS